MQIGAEKKGESNYWLSTFLLFYERKTEILQQIEELNLDDEE